MKPSKVADQGKLINSLITNFVPTGNLRRDVAAFLALHSCADTAGHVAQVAAEAKRLAQRFGASVDAAEVAGLLHDISAPIPNQERLAAAHAFGLDVLPEEATFPMIIHQKLSVVLARDIFGVTAPEPLSAIGCHTTLKADASLLDKVVFVADKVKWDGVGEPPYLAALQQALARSLDHAAFCYLDYLWQRRATLRVVHPWLVAAHQQLQDLV
ncbi:MAG: HD domain-containing protein [Caldilinea sp. CFX5]|nr:HD domain-containing protein [Caldilinea sp. CFX5]